MGFLESNCFFSKYTKEIATACNNFSCGNADMDDFFQNDAFDYSMFRMGQSYCFRLEDSPKEIICILTLSNDSIRIYDLPRSRKDYMLRITHHQKKLNRYPGVLLGRIGVNTKYADKGIGSEAIDFIKEWFITEDIISGCRFIIVDAINEPKALHFYSKNQFSFLFSSESQEDLYTNPPKDEKEKTDRENNPLPLRSRLMYYDLLNLR